MNVKLENTGPCRKTLVVELPVERVTDEYGKIAREFAASAAVPGYRKGKAPLQLVERRYEKAILDEVRDRLISGSYRAALKEHDINPVAILDLTDVLLESGKPMKYKVVLDVPPEFKLPKYKKISVKPRKTEVSDEDVQRELDLLLERYADYKPVDGRSARRGDLVQIDYECCPEDMPAEGHGRDAAGLAKGRDFWMITDKNAFLPGFDEGLDGMAVGEAKEIKSAFPADFRHEAWAGKTATYRVTLKGIREKLLPEMNDAFFRQAGVESEEALRAKLRELLEAQADHREKSRLKQEITADLIKSVTMDLPESVVREETRNMFSSLVRENVRRGVTKERIEEQKEVLLESAAKSAEERVKAGYILHRIAEAEGIKVEQAEVDKAVAETAASRGVDPDTVRKELEEAKAMDSVRHEILAAKTLDFLLENAGTEEAGLLSRLIRSKHRKETVSS